MYERAPVTMRHVIAWLSVAALSGCSVPHPGVAVPTGQLVRPNGSVIGEARIFDQQSGSMIHIKAAGLPPGTHGVHLHAVGRCDGPGFPSAGPHWNPTHRQHGHDNPAGYHEGDLGNVSVGPDGTIDTDLIATDVRLRAAPGSKGLIVSDRDGTSLVIHASPDDERTDPSGNSGERIACAVVAAPLL
jgi:superoxide dismutase, Cu-Zn family